MYTIIEKDRLLEILVDKDELNLDKTFNCGQAFRWNKQPSGEWVGVVNNKIYVLKQVNDIIYTNLREEDKEELISYLNLDMDYTSEIAKLNLTEFELNAYEKAKGIHILRQDLFETMVTFMMSSCNTMNNIRRIINSLCESYGEDLKTEYYGKVITGKSFPTLDKLASISAEELRTHSMGFRADYLSAMCKFLYYNKQYLDELKQFNYQESINKLKILEGIGPKVANCIALFSLHHIEAFPIDTHIKKIIQEEYDGYIDLKRFGNIAGIIQQYLFYYKAFN